MKSSIFLQNQRLILQTKHIIDMKQLLGFTKKYLVMFTVSSIGLVSCSLYKYNTSTPLSLGEIKLNMDKEDFLAKCGQPFSFKIKISENDTITVLSYKSPRVVANCEFIVTTDLLFINNKLKTISQSDFYVPQNVVVCDSTKVLLKND